MVKSPLSKGCNTILCPGCNPENYCYIRLNLYKKDTQGKLKVVPYTSGKI